MKCKGGRVGKGGNRKVSSLYKVVKEDLTGKGVFDQRLKGIKRPGIFQTQGTKNTKSWDGNILEMFKEPEVPILINKCRYINKYNLTIQKKENT